MAETAVAEAVDPATGAAAAVGGAGAPATSAAGAVGTPVPAAPPEWLSTLQDETLRGDKTLAKYKTADEAHKAHVELQGAYGKKLEGMVKLPPAGSKLDSPEVKAYREAAGIPLTVEGYKDVRVPETAEGSINPDAIKAWIENVALPRGMSVEDAQANVNFLAENNSQAMTAFREKLIESQATLRQKWGANFNREIEMARRATLEVEKAAGLSGELFKMIGDMGLNEHPDWIQWWAWTGRNLFERGIIPGHVEGSATQDELKEKIRAVRADTKDPFNDAGHKDHEARRAEVAGWYRAAYGTAKV